MIVKMATGRLESLKRVCARDNALVESKNASAAFSPSLNHHGSCLFATPVADVDFRSGSLRYWNRLCCVPPCLTPVTLSCR